MPPIKRVAKSFPSLVLSLLLTTGLALAQAPPAGFSGGEVHTRITTSRVQQYKILVAPMPVEGLRVAQHRTDALALREVVIDDLDFSLRFDALNRRIEEYAFAVLSSDKDRVDFPGWQGTGAEYLVAGAFSDVEGTPMVEVRVYDLSLKDLVFLKNYTIDFKELRKVAHRIADDIVLNVTGERGVASTSLATVMATSDSTREIFLCDYDGFNLRRLTRDGNISKMPAWSPDGKQLGVTSSRGDWDLYVADVPGGRLRPFHVARGVDQSMSWCERNGFVAFSSSQNGDQEIYYLRPGEGKPVRVTFSYTTDMEPSWSPNGTELAFTSMRAGNPHIFIMDADGLNLRRVTFESRNTTPRWRPLPYGDKILVTSEIRGVFQIAIIDITGDNFIQLTTEGENRDPAWSPDGLHVVFATDRRGGRGNFEIYTMDWDGGNQRPISPKFRSGENPAWSPFIEQ